MLTDNCYVCKKNNIIWCSCGNEKKNEKNVISIRRMLMFVKYVVKLNLMLLLNIRQKNNRGQYKSINHIKTCLNAYKLRMA